MVWQGTLSSYRGNYYLGVQLCLLRAGLTWSASVWGLVISVKYFLVLST